MKELYRFRQFLAEGVIKENISSHKEEAKRFLEKFVDDNEDKFEFIPDLETGYIDANDNSYNVDELASIFLDIGQDIPKGTHNQKYKGEGGTYVVVAEGRLFEEDMTSKAVSILKSYKGEVKGLEDYIKYLMNTNDDISSSIQAVADDMDRDNDAEDSLRRDLEKLSLAEGKLIKEEVDVLGNEFTQEIQDDMKTYYKMDVDMDDIKDWVKFYYIDYNSEYDDGPGDVDYEGNEFGSEDYESEKKELVFDTAEREDFYMHLNPEADSTFPNLKENYKNDYANSEEDFTDEMVVQKIKDIIKYHELDPQDLIDEIRIEFGVDAMD